MALRKLSMKASEKDAGKRLDQVLTEWLPVALAQPVSKGKARKLVMAGAAYLNGSRVRIASKAVRAGARIEVFVDLEKLMSGGPSKDVPFEMSASDVLYEDEHLIAVSKPPGLPTQPTLDEARANLVAAVRAFLKGRDRVAQPYVGLHHRLDRDTSGVVLFTKSPAANPGVARLFAEHLARKTYHALVAGAPKLEEWAVRNHLGRKPGPGKRARFGQVKSGGDLAHTDFRLLERLRGAAWVEARPLTGRTHQIRVHLSEGGTPILADDLYGGPELGAPRLMLHAAELAFPHPLDGRAVSVPCPPPEDFQRCLRALRG